MGSMVTVTHLLFDFTNTEKDYEEGTNPYFAAFWRTLRGYYGESALPPVDLMLAGLGQWNSPARLAALSTWHRETAEGGRVTSDIFTTPVERLFWEIPHAQHEDLLHISCSVIFEIFFRHSREQEFDTIRVWMELKTWFFQPLLKELAALPTPLDELEDFRVTYVHPASLLRTVSLAEFAREVGLFPL